MLTSTEPEAHGAVAGAVLPRLFQLASPALPVGAFAYSEGLERAVEDGLVHGEAGARDWILGLLEHCQSRLDLPLFVRLYAAWQENDEARARELSRWLLACRDTAELRATDRQLGQALARMLQGRGDAGAGAWLRDRDATFAALFARAAVRWAIPVRDAAAALAWT